MFLRPYHLLIACTLAFCLNHGGASTYAAQQANTRQIPEVERILNSHTKAMGDIPAWDLVQMTITQGTFEFGKPGTHFTEWRRRPQLLRIQWKSPEKKLLLDTGCNRTVAWYVANENEQVKRETIPLGQASSLVRKAQLESNIIKATRSAYRNWTLRGSAAAGNTRYYIIDHTSDNGDEETFYIDEKTFYILRHERKTPRGVEAEEYGDYRIINSIPWPHRIVYFENDEKKEVAQINSIAINAGIGSPFFMPPPEDKNATLQRLDRKSALSPQ